MRARTLGKTGIKVGEVGFGAWAIGGPAELGGLAVGWGEVDDRDSIRALEAAFDEGINFYDTADVYGMGHSEELLARVFGKRRAQVVIATKGGNFNDEAGQWQKSFTGPFLAGKVEESLRRLRSDYIDLYQLHTPRTDEEYRQALGSAETLDRLVEQGKLRAYGLSIGPVEHGLRQIGDGFGATIQVVYNALERGPEEKLLPAAKEANYGVIPRVPLASGFLTGKYTDDARFDKRDHRSRLTAEQKKDWVEKVNRLKPIAKELGLTMTQLALQYILASDAVSVVIPGARSADQARQNAAVGKLPPLSEAAVKRIRQAVE
ncbi:MAG: aldo/keto reductase [candidate division NC10 bacterium]|nr:aldo/keto reductase [candidate division NC10 bacterium]